MKNNIYINPDWFKGYIIRQGEKNIGQQIFDSIEEARDYIDYINNLCITNNIEPFKDYSIEYKDYSSEIGHDLINELRKFI